MVLTLFAMHLLSQKLTSFCDRYKPLFDWATVTAVVSVAGMVAAAGFHYNRRFQQRLKPARVVKLPDSKSCDAGHNFIIATAHFTSLAIYFLRLLAGILVMLASSFTCRSLPSFNSFVT